MAMKVKEIEIDIAKRIKDRMSFCPGVTSAVTKQYLDNARGHYLSALAGKQERTNICDSSAPFSVLEHNVLEHSTEAEEMSFLGMDTLLHSPNIVLKECDRTLQVKMGQFDKSLQKNTSEKIAEMIGVTGDSGHKVEPVVTERENTTTALIGVKGYSLKGPVEGVSLKKMVKSLKVELENLKKEHAELKDKEKGTGFDTRDLHLKLLKSTHEHESNPLNQLTCSHSSERIPEDRLEEDGCKVEGKGVKRVNENPKFSGQMVKKHRVSPSFDKGKDTMLSSFDQNKCMPRKIFDTCVSTSESSVRVRFSEDELESSSQKAVKSDKPERNKFTVIGGQVDSPKYALSSEFSIRNYVFAARNKDISTNWPFSHKNLQLCLKHGVKNILPPFQSADSMPNNLKRRLTNTSLHSEESKLDGRPLGQKSHLIPNTRTNHQWNPELTQVYRDSDLKESAFKSTTHSEVESVSTNNVLLSEVSDEQVASASASASASVPAGMKATKSCASQPSNKKCKMGVKMHVSGSRGVTDDITSASTTALSEAMASKICPVCQVFSSPSNTTLNAHIDQCLSSQSPPNWRDNSRVVKPRIKPRKMRSMSDICATAPCCTLEDLDRRNGTNWATNSEFFSQDIGLVNQGKSCVSTRHVNNDDDGAVYIDSSGRKIRILSKFNDVLSSSLRKVEEDARSKKQSKLGKTSKFFSTKRKGRLRKHLKYLKGSQQRKILSYRKIKARLNEARGSAETTPTSGEKLVSEQQKAPFVSFPGTLKLWISSKRSRRSRTDDPKDIDKPVQFDQKERVSKSSIEREDEFDADGGENADSSYPNNGGLSDGSLLSPCEGIRSNNTETNNPKQKDVALEESLVCGKDAMGDTPCGEIRARSDPLFNYQKICKIKNSLTHRRKRGFVPSQDDGGKKTCDYSDEMEDNNGCETSVSAPISSPAFAEAVIDSKRSIDPESENAPISSVHCFDPFELKTQISGFDACQTLFIDVDPIPIPGPPGSDLPSFSDMGSDSSLAQSSGDGDDEVNGNQSESPLSAASTVSNLGMGEDVNLSVPEYFPSVISGSDNAHQGWFTVGSCDMFSELDKINARDRGHPISLEECSCSLKEDVPWNATLNFEGSQVVGQMGKHVGSTLNGRKNCLDGRNTSQTSCQQLMSPMRVGGCDSLNSGPILRLMGKDLMVVNKAKDDISMDRVVQSVCNNREVRSVSDFYNGYPRSWQHQPLQSQGMSFIGPLLHGQVPDIVLMQRSEDGSLDMINNTWNPKQLSHSQVNMYVDNNMRASFSTLGTAPLKQ